MVEKCTLGFFPKSPREIGEESQSIAQELSKDEEYEKIEVYNTYRYKDKDFQWLGFTIRLNFENNTFKEHHYKITGNMAELQ